MHLKIKKLYLKLFLILAACKVFTQNIDQAPIITSVGDAIYCPQSEQKIVSFFNIENVSELDALYIQISEGYIPVEDQLIYGGFNPNIDVTWSVAEGKLEISSLNGDNLPVSEIINAVYDISFISNNPNPSDKSFSFTIGDANYLPLTGHYYIYFSAPGISWNQAKENAENTNYFGLQGYLATILSEEENQILLRMH